MTGLGVEIGLRVDTGKVRNALPLRWHVYQLECLFHAFIPGKLSPRERGILEGEICRVQEKQTPDDKNFQVLIPVKQQQI